MTVRYQADNDLRKAIVRGTVRRDPRIDFRSAQSAHLDDIPDPEVLALAAREGRILVSHDFQTMPHHFRQFTRHQLSPGVLLIRQDMPVGDAIDTLLLIWEASEADEWKDRLCLVSSLATIAVGRSR
jgi:predicted nuclease of predicted toxin-antitoxin system